jgi:hypothetical protein
MEYIMKLSSDSREKMISACNCDDDNQCGDCPFPTPDDDHPCFDNCQDEICIDGHA